MPRRRSKPVLDEIRVDERGVTCTTAGEVRSMRWSELAEVRLLTGRAQPDGPDLVFLLVGDADSCVVPHTLAPTELLDHLQALPDFDNGELICALGSTTSAEFVCWRRAA